MSLDGRGSAAAQALLDEFDARAKSCIVDKQMARLAEKPERALVDVNTLVIGSGHKHPQTKKLETFLAGALYREFREFMRILTTFLGKIHRNPSQLVQTAETPEL